MERAHASGLFFFMKLIKLLCICVTFFPSIVVARALTIDESNFDFGEKHQFSEITHDVRVWNNSDKPVSVVALTKLIGLGHATINKETIKPQESALVHLDVPLERSIGRTSSRFLLETKESGQAERYSIRVTGYVESALDDPNEVMDFGTLQKGKAAEKKVLAFSSAEYPNLRVTKVLESPAFVTVSVVNDGRAISVQPGHFTMLGLNSALIKLALNSPTQSEAWVQVVAEVQGSVVPDQDPLIFGLQRQGHRVPVRLQLSDRQGREFEASMPKIEDARMDVAATDCFPTGTKGCRAFLFTVQKVQPLGQIFGKAIFNLPDTKEILTVNFAGMLLDDKTPVQPLDKILKRAPEIGQSADKVSEPLAQAIKHSVSPAVEAVVPPGIGPLLKWQVANEAGIYGYAIFRGDEPDGHFIRVNTDILKAHNGGDDTNASYQWRDTSAGKGHIYWYFITIYYNDGHKQQLTGPQKVIAK